MSLQAKLSLLTSLILLAGCKTPEKLIFTSDREGNSDIYIMEEDGSHTKQLTSSNHPEWAPTIMNDREITFLRQEDDRVARYRLNLTTMVETRMEHPPGCVLEDKNILYEPATQRELYECNGDLFVRNLGEITGENITADINGNSSYPSWMPGQNAVLFTNDGDGNNDIYSINLSTKKLDQITDHPHNDERGEISPDGKWLIFSSDRDNPGNQDLYLMDLETKSMQNITNTPSLELIGRWSPSGRKIYYGSNKDGNWEIYSYDMEHKKTYRLTTSDSFDGDPRVYK